VAATSARATPIEQRSFGRTRDGVEAKIYTLTNANGLVAKVTDYGATLTELWIPDRNGKLADIVNMGSEFHYIIDSAEGRIMAVEPNRAGARVQKGEPVSLQFRPEDCVVLARDGG
jgi:aldose 1-epimerase